MAIMVTQPKMLNAAMVTKLRLLFQRFPCLCVIVSSLQRIRSKFHANERNIMFFNALCRRSNYCSRKL